jgi:hypothetical protein
VDRSSIEAGLETAKREALLEELARCLRELPWEERVMVESRLLLRGQGDLVNELRRRIDRLADRRKSAQ